MSNKYDLDEELEERPFSFGLFKRMMRYVVPYRRSVFVLSIFLLISLVAGLLDPLLIRYAIDEGISKANTYILNKAVILVLILYILNFVSSYIRIKMTNRIGQRLIYDMRKELFDHLQKLSFRFFDGRPAGKIMSRVTNDVQAISDMINNGIITVVTETLVLIGILIIIFYLNWKLSMVVISVIPILGLIILKIQPASEKAWRRTRKTIANINAIINESLQGIRVIQAFSRQKHNFDKFKKINRENYKAHVFALAIELLFFPCVELVGMIGTCIVIWYGAKQVISGEQTIGTIVAFINYVWRFWAPLSAISTFYSQVLSAMASAERIFGILDMEPEIKDKPDAIHLQDIKGDIVFENVSFGYNPEEKMVLRNISFEVHKGEVLALVGATGAGKTSIVNLLMRFYDVNEGAIYIDGHNIKDISIASLRKHVGMVLQEPYIFSGTIKENILYGKLDASDDEVVAAAKATKVYEFAQKFPEGLDTQVEERGARLSVGQRQLVAFARALIANPKILILDEATSNVDTETEKHIQEALKELFKDRTSIVIAHRLSTIENADKIIVIDNGMIKEQGTHKELLDKKGVYYRLYLKQFQDDESDEEEQITA